MLDKLTQLHKSKFFKCFLIAIVLVFSYEVSKPKAIAPLVGWAGAVLVGMAAESLITMGVKAGSKAILERKAKSYSAEMARTGQFDFPGTNPYRNKDGSITLTPSANDRAKIAGLIGGSLIGSMYGNGTQEEINYCYQKKGFSRLAPILPPWTPPEVFNESDRLNLKYMQQYLTAYRSNGADIQGRYQYVIESKINGSLLMSYWHLSPSLEFISHGRGVDLVYGGFGETSVLKGDKFSFGMIGADGGLLASNDVAESVGADLSMCDDLLIPSTVERVYPAPMNMSSTYQMPNHGELADKPITIYNVMPPVDTPGEITWKELDDYYENNGLIADDVMNGNMDAYLEKGDYNSNVYTVGEINNYYTDVNYPEKIEDFVPELVEGGVPVVPGDNLPGEPVEELDHSMWQVMRNTYNYLDDGIDSSLAAMKGITDSASGITNYLGQTMGWLPAEWRAVFTSAFVLGVFAHFLRR